MFATGRRVHSPFALANAYALSVKPYSPRPSLVRTLTDFVPKDYGNKTKPTCTFVSYTNAARGVAFLNGTELVVDPGSVDRGYSAVAGCANNDNAILATDGLQMLDVVSYQNTRGYNVGPQLLVASHGTIPMNKISLARAMETLGLPWLGVVLFQRDMDDFGPSSVLDIASGRSDGQVVGRHAVPGWSYLGLGEDDRVYIGTWGQWQAVTWRWLLARIEEAHGLMWRQLCRPDGTYFNGTRWPDPIQFI